MKRAFVFPGQGSQSVGMGQSLAQSFPAARRLFAEIDEALAEPLSRLMFAGPEDELTLTENAQPALMAASLAVIRVLEAEAGFVLGDRVAYVAGHSLGEYSALAAAGAIAVADAARLLKLRGRAMQRAVPVGKGAMAALLGLDLDTARAVAREAEESAGGVCAVANDNAPGQVVVSGDREAVERAIAFARERGGRRSILLPVSAPFHSPLMTPAAAAMGEALDGIELRPPEVPLVANVSAAPTIDPEEIRRGLVAQVTAMVRWRESVAFSAGARGRRNRRNRRRARALRACQADRTRDFDPLGRIAPPISGRSSKRCEPDVRSRRPDGAGDGSLRRDRRRHRPGAAPPGRGGHAVRHAGSGARALAEELGESAHVAPADLADPAAPERLVKEAEAAMGRVDILVNNAGLTRDALSLRMREEEWQEVIEVNLNAVFRLTRAALRGMVRRRHGRVIAVTSIVAVTGNPGQANYAAAKGRDDRHGEIDRRRGRRPRSHGQLRSAGLHPDADDGETPRGATDPACSGNSRRPIRQARGRRRRDRLFGERGGRLRHRTNLARQRRYGHGIASPGPPGENLAGTGQPCYGSRGLERGP